MQNKLASYKKKNVYGFYFNVLSSITFILSTRWAKGIKFLVINLSLNQTLGYLLLAVTTCS